MRASEGPHPHAVTLEVLELSFGRFPEASGLNPRFVPGHARFKLTLDVRVSPAQARADPGAWLESLERLLPTLGRHRCCGDGRISGNLQARRRGPPPGATAGWPAVVEGDEDDPGLDIAHLFEHLVIDLQHFIAGMTRCSGVTCARRTPAHRYDLFVESPDRRVSRLCIALAIDLLARTVAGRGQPARTELVLRTARHAHLCPDAMISAASARASGLGGAESDLETALQTLRALGFIRDADCSINFSNRPVYFCARDLDSNGL